MSTPIRATTAEQIATARAVLEGLEQTLRDEISALHTEMALLRTALEDSERSRRHLHTTIDDMRNDAARRG